jgi:DnaJ-class molecular chaperone
MTGATADLWHPEMVLARNRTEAIFLQTKRKEAAFMTPKIQEHTCTTCNGTGFPTVKQPTLATRKIYPVKCEACGGKGRIADTTD